MAPPAGAPMFLDTIKYPPPPPTFPFVATAVMERAVGSVVATQSKMMRQLNTTPA